MKPKTKQFHVYVTVGASVMLACLIGTACNFDWQTELDANVIDAAQDGDTQDSNLLEDATLTDGGSNDADADESLDSSSDGDAPFVSDSGVCSPSAPCESGKYCRYPDYYCGTGGNGQCTDKPTSCADAALQTSCACDSNSYLSPCAAAMGGVDVSRQAPCSNPPNTFRCGYLHCKNTEYCSIKSPGAQAQYTCKSLGGCALGCLCIALNCLGGSCAVEDGHVVERCQ